MLNVLTGDMSIIRPRPKPLKSKARNRLFQDIDSRYWHRHGATENEADLINRLQAELECESDCRPGVTSALPSSAFRVLVHENAY